MRQQYLRVSAGLQVKLTLSSKAILSIILTALCCGGLQALRLTFLPAWLTNLVAACGLAHSMAAYGGLRWRLCRGLRVNMSGTLINAITRGQGFYRDDQPTFLLT